MMNRRSICETALLSLVLFLALLSCMSLEAFGQVTFSRDWNAGKRSGGDAQCSALLQSAEHICRVMVEGFRQLAACETKSILRFHQEFDDKQAEVFLEGQEGR